MYVMAVEICMNWICNFTDAIIKIVFLFEKGYGVENEITALLTALMMCMTFGANFVYAADSNSARNAVLQIREEIDSHKSNIQSKNGELFKLTPEEIARSGF